MSKELKQTPVEQAVENLRELNNMGADLLARAAQEELPQLDVKLFNDFLSRKVSRRPKSRLTKKHGKPDYDELEFC